MIPSLVLGILVSHTSTTPRGHSSHIKPQLHITPVLQHHKDILYIKHQKSHRTLHKNVSNIAYMYVTFAHILCLFVTLECNACILYQILFLSHILIFEIRWKTWPQVICFLCSFDFKSGHISDQIFGSHFGGIRFLALGVQNLHHREISVIGDVKYATAVLRCNTTLFSYITSPIAVQYGGGWGWLP